jgi:hypothetical protein
LRLDRLVRDGKREQGTHGPVYRAGSLASYLSWIKSRSNI